MFRRNTKKNYLQQMGKENFIPYNRYTV